MSVPARRKSSSSVRRRRSHDALKAQNVGVCTACAAPLMSHQACKNCGNYKGKQVLDVSRQTARAVKSVTPAKQVVEHTHDHGDHSDHGHDEPVPAENKKSKKKAS